MKRLMKKFVLLTLLLQLCIHVQGMTEGPLRKPMFGDILRIDRKLSCIDKTVYSHYAVFVGDTPMKGKKPDEDIFEMTKVGLKTGCRFSKLKEEARIYNYKDDTLPRKSYEEMKQTIETMNEKCGTWTFTNTCEHVATQVRHGEANRQCNQQGTFMEPMCKLFKKDKRRRRGSKYLRPAAAAA